MNLTRKLSISGGRKEWAVSGPLGSLAFWVETYGSGTEGRIFGGVENHYNAISRPDYLDYSEPHTDCTLNGGFCWHVGTSLWASEHWIPNIYPQGDEFIWRALERYYPERMGDI